MGWTSYLEDIEKRLDDAVQRFHLPSGKGDFSKIGLEGLQKTNDLLREKNENFLRVISELKDEISSKKRTDFCEDECVRLKKTNFDLVCRLKYIQEMETPLHMPSRKEAHAPRQSNSDDKGSRVQKANAVAQSQELSEVKKRYLVAQRAVETAKNLWKDAQKACSKVQNEYQNLLQSERNSTQHICESGIIIYHSPVNPRMKDGEKRK